MNSTDTVKATDTDYALSADDLASLKIADSMTFHHYRGNAFMQVHLRGHDSRIYTTKEQRLTPSVEAHGDRCRSIVVDPADLVAYPDATGFVMIMHADYNDTWLTTVSLLRVGDVLKFRWNAGGGNNEYVKRAGLHVDRLSLVVSRGDKKLTFHIATGVCADNTARMIRFAE